MGGESSVGMGRRKYFAVNFCVIPLGVERTAGQCTEGGG